MDWKLKIKNKKCRKCGVELNSDNTTKYLIKTMGFICSECNREYKRKWAAENIKKNPHKKIKIKEWSKKYYSKNKLRKKEWKEKNWEKLLLEKPLFCRECGVLLTPKNSREYLLKNFDIICFDCLSNKRMEEHLPRKIMADHLGVPLEALKGREVHHLDGNPKNNSISNLLLLTCGAHSIIHNKLSKGIRPIQKVYLAAPIDGVSQKIAQSWRQKAYDMLAQKAIISLVPGNETRGLLTPQEIVDLDKSMIENADAVLANLNFLTNAKLGRGSGTLAELGMALSNHKPIIAFAEGDLGTNFFIKGLCGNVFSTLEEAIQVLVSINRNLEHKYSNINYNKFNGKGSDLKINKNKLLDKLKKIFPENEAREITDIYLMLNNF